MLAPRGRGARAEERDGARVCVSRVVTGDVANSRCVSGETGANHSLLKLLPISRGAGRPPAVPRPATVRWSCVAAFGRVKQDPGPFCFPMKPLLRSR